MEQFAEGIRARINIKRTNILFFQFLWSYLWLRSLGLERIEAEVMEPSSSNFKISRHHL